MDQEVVSEESLPCLLVLAIYQMHLTPAVLQLIVLFLLLTETPLGLGHSLLRPDGSSVGNPGQSWPIRGGTGSSGIIPTSRTHILFSAPTWTLAAATSQVSPCTQVTLTVLPTSAVLGRTKGRAKVIVLPESKTALTGQRPCSWTWMLGSLELGHLTWEHWAWAHLVVRGCELLTGHL